MLDNNGHNKGKGRRAYLAHEVRDHPVESGSLVAEAWLPCAQRSEVLCNTDRSQIPA